MGQGFLLVLWFASASLHWHSGGSQGFAINVPREAPDTVNLFGYYSIVDAPSWCANIEVLHLSTINFRGNTLIRVPLWGFIRLKGAPVVDYRLVKLALAGRTFTFTTEQHRGISYDFVGDFLRLGDFPHRPPNGQVILVGHLRMLPSGTVTNSAEVKFSYNGGH
jgi:hypothetical protein